MADRPLSRISKSIREKGHEGIFKRAARRAGYSNTFEYARHVKNEPGASTTTKKRAALALTYEAHQK